MADEAVTLAVAVQTAIGDALLEQLGDFLVREGLVFAFLLDLSDDVSEELCSGARLQLVYSVVVADKVYQSALAWRLHRQVDVECALVMDMVLVLSIDTDAKERKLQDLLHAG